MRNLEKFTNETLKVSISATDLNGTVWFVAQDVADALGYENPSKAYEFCKSLNLLQSSELGDLNKINNLHGMTKWCNESDVYRMVMRSKKPNAELLQDWVVEEVLPSIRKTGSYQGKPKSQLEMLADGFAAMARIENEQRAAAEKLAAIESTTTHQTKLIEGLQQYTRNGVPALHLSKKQAHFKYGKFLSKESFEAVMVAADVPTHKYTHSENGHSIHTFAYLESAVAPAINTLLSECEQVSPCFCNWKGMQFEYKKA